MSSLRRGVAYDPTGVFPPTIKWLLIANGAVYVLDGILLPAFLGIQLKGLLGLTPAWVIDRGPPAAAARCVKPVAGWVWRLAPAAGQRSLVG